MSTSLDRVNVKRLSPTAIIPTTANQDDAGYDLYFDCTDPHDMMQSQRGIVGVEKHIVLRPHGEDITENYVRLREESWAVFPTNITVETPSGYAVFVHSRSGMGAKHGVGLANGVGVVDAGYRNGIGVILFNHGKEPVRIKHGDRIGQMIIQKIEKPALVEVDSLSETERGLSGFGDSGR